MKPISEARFSKKAHRKGKKRIGRTFATLDETPKLSPNELLKLHSTQKPLGKRL